ncbi:MAG: hypothetical protein R3E86_11960 [Pseudomonadales bacterium]
MPVSYHINANDGLITLRIEGDVELEEIRRQAERMFADPDYDSALPQLVDVRGMRLQPPGHAERAFRRYIAEHYGPRVQSSLAAVIDGDLDGGLCAAIFRLTCSVPGAELFDDYDHALRWLMRREFAPAHSCQA